MPKDDFVYVDVLALGSGDVLDVVVSIGAARRRLLAPA
jgi:hypothetical protein